MKRQFVGIFTAFVATILLPYIITVLINPSDTSTNTVTPIDGRIIVMEDNSSHKYLDYNNYIKYMTARNLMAFDPEVISTYPDFVQLNCILSNTFMEKNYSDTTTINEAALAQYIADDEALKSLWKDKYEEYMAVIHNATLNTSGQYLAYNSLPITPFYHFLSSGATRSSIDENLSYLKTADTSSDFEAPGFLTVVAYTWEDFASLINSAVADSNNISNNTKILDYTLSPKDQIQVTSRDTAGYVENININDFILSGEDFASIFSLKSTAFTLIYGDDSIKIVTKGYGHGYGISLTYALSMFEEGKSIDEVINYFFNDVEIICS